MVPWPSTFKTAHEYFLSQWEALGNEKRRPEATTEMDHEEARRELLLKEAAITEGQPGEHQDPQSVFGRPQKKQPGELWFSGRHLSQCVASSTIVTTASTAFALRRLAHRWLP